MFFHIVALVHFSCCIIFHHSWKSPQILLLTDAWIVSSLGLWLKMLLWTFVVRWSACHCPGSEPRGGLAGWSGVQIFIPDKAKRISRAVITICIPAVVPIPTHSRYRQMFWVCQLGACVVGPHQSLNLHFPADQWGLHCFIFNGSLCFLFEECL